MTRLRNKTLNFTLFVLASCAASSCGDVEPTDTTHDFSAILPEPDMNVRALTVNELNAFSNDPRMLPVLESARFDNLSPDYASARHVTATNGLPGSETWVALVDQNGAPTRESIVLQDAAGDPEVFRIDDVLEIPVPTSTAPGALRQALFGCGPWSGWSHAYSYCGKRFWCFSRGQIGTWIKYQRTRQCRSWTQIDSRDAFQYCGC